MDKPPLTNFVMIVKPVQKAGIPLVRVLAQKRIDDVLEENWKEVLLLTPKCARKLADEILDLPPTTDI